MGPPAEADAWTAGCLPAGVSYVHNAVDETLLEALEALRTTLPAEALNVRMGDATRRRFRSDEVARRITATLAVHRREPLVASAALRFIEYAAAGFIARHTDGPSFDEMLARETTHSFLLYLATTRDGGATQFVCGDDVIIATVTPRRGSLLVFPHEIPHQGEACAADPKILLRGDLVDVSMPRVSRYSPPRVHRPPVVLGASLPPSIDHRGASVGSPALQKDGEDDAECFGRGVRGSCQHTTRQYAI